MRRALVDMAESLLVGAACGFAHVLLDVAAGRLVRDVDGRLIPARLTDEELTALRGGAS